MHRNTILNTHIFLGLALVMAVVLGACSVFKDKPLPERVNDMYRLITVVSNEVVQNISDGIYTKDEMRPIVNDLADAKENLDIVDALTNQGKISEAEAKFKLTERALNSARKWLTDKRKEKAK